MKRCTIRPRRSDEFDSLVRLQFARRVMPFADPVGPISPEWWAWLVANQRLIAKALKRFNYEVLMDFTYQEFLAACGPWIVSQLAKRHDPSRSSVSTLAFYLVRSCFSILRGNRSRPRQGRFFVCPRDETPVGRNYPPLLLGSQTEDLYERFDRDPDTTDLQDAVADAFAELDDRRKMILNRFLGIGVPATTLKVLSQELAISKERVRQLAESALAAMRKKMGVSERTGLVVFFTRREGHKYGKAEKNAYVNAYRKRKKLAARNAPLVFIDCGESAESRPDHRMNHAFPFIG